MLKLIAKNINRFCQLLPQTLANKKLHDYLIQFIAIFSVPVVFWLLFPVVFSSNVGYIDPFIYIGYGLNYLDPSYLSSYYKISRLPWVLVQFVFRNLFNENLASHFLHFAVYSSASYFIFKICKKNFDVVVAFVLSLVTPVLLYHYSGGADYNNSFSAVLFLALIFYVADRVLQSKDDWRFFVWVGIIYALVMHTNVLLSLDVVIYAACFYIALKIKQDKPIFDLVIQKIILIIVGFVVCTLVLCLINYSVGRQFWFMSPLWQFVISGGQNEGYWKPLGSFILEAGHLRCFLVMAIVSFFVVIYMAIRKSYFKKPLIFFANLAFVMVFAELILTQILRLNNLQILYFAFSALVPFLLTLAANLNALFEYLRKYLGSKSVAIIALAACFVVLFPLTKIAGLNVENLHCNESEALTKAYIEFNEHVKKYKQDFAVSRNGNIFGWRNKSQNISYNDCLKDKKTSLDNFSISMIAASSAGVYPLTDVWKGDAKIDNLWQNDNDWFKTYFFSKTEYPRVVVMITYDEKDVKKMIAQMKEYGINFNLAEKRRIITDAFWLGYFILVEEKPNS